MIWHDGWKYIILAACDVEGNFLVVKAYNYTNLLSCMLLDACVPFRPYLLCPNLTFRSST